MNDDRGDDNNKKLNGGNRPTLSQAFIKKEFFRTHYVLRCRRPRSRTLKHSSRAFPTHLLFLFEFRVIMTTMSYSSYDFVVVLIGG